jgi:gamma-glutamyl hydrolase
MKGSVLFLLCCLASVTVALNDWPIIGIYAQPSDSTNSDYIAASYVKWIESAGGRVVPLPFHISNEHADGNFSVLNGLLFPGGGAAVPDEAKYLYNLAVQANIKGDYFPVWGTCLGFEWLLQMQGGVALDTGFDSENYSIPLNFTDYVKQSRIFANASADLINIFASEPVCMNNHQAGLTPDHFNAADKLTSFFNLISTNNDRKGRTFISMIESKSYPIYGGQWHPEKNTYEFGEYSDGTPYEAINHSRDARAVTEFIANFFVDECRKSTHKYPSEAVENAALIYNYPVTKTGPEFVQTYYLF